jgi:hypothetical protein
MILRVAKTKPVRIHHALKNYDTIISYNEKLNSIRKLQAKHFHPVALWHPYPMFVSEEAHTCVVFAFA